MQPGEETAPGDFTHVCNPPMGCSADGTRLFSALPSESTRGDGHKLRQRVSILGDAPRHLAWPEGPAPGKGAERPHLLPPDTAWGRRPSPHRGTVSPPRWAERSGAGPGCGGAAEPRRAGPSPGVPCRSEPGRARHGHRSHRHRVRLLRLLAEGAAGDAIQGAAAGASAGQDRHLHRRGAAAAPHLPRLRTGGLHR